MKNDPLKKGQIKKYPSKKAPSPQKKVKRKNYSDIFGFAIIILLGILIYSNSFLCSFHFDDLYAIVDNLKIRNLSDVKAIWNFSPNRPVPIFTFALNYHFNQLDVRYWHLVNLIIHLINACLVWWLTLLIFSSPTLKDYKIVKHKKILAFLTALLFVSHPLATQSVTYIVQRMTSLVAMFYLLSLSLYIKARLSDKGNTSKVLLFAGCFISALLAMLTKENAFTLPFAIILVEFFFIRTRKLSINFKDYRVILLMAAFLCMILIIPLKYSFSIFRPLPPTLGHADILTPFNYFLTQFSVIVKYIQLLILPVNQMVDYDFPISNSFFEIRTLLSFLVLLFLVFLIFFLFKRNRIISFGIAWFFLTLSIESSFIPINDVIFEHRTYLPSIGFFLILISVIYFLLWEKYKYLAIVIVTIIIGSNSYMTYERNKVWKDDLTLWNDNVAKALNFARPIYSRGYAYGNLMEWDKAIADYTRALEIDPNYTDGYSNRGNAYGTLKQWDKAIADYTKAIKIDPKHAKAYNNRGIAFGRLKEWNKALDDYSSAIGINLNFAEAYNNRGVAFENLNELDKAIADYSRAIGIDPNYADAYFNRGHTYGTIQDWVNAIADYSRVIRIDPNYADAYLNRANIYKTLQQWDKAITDYSSLTGINPDYANAYFSRGYIYGLLKQWEKAIADYSKTIEINPNYADAYYNRGITFGNLMEWDKAIADYSAVINIDPKYKQAFVNRGLAYGNLGKWDKAIEDYTKALGIDPNFTIASVNREIAYSNLKNSKNK